jgi:hypothetical protein
MKMLDLEHARGSLGRGLARQALAEAEAGCADASGIVHSLHDLAPNPRNGARHARRLMRRRGVLRASATRGGVAVVFRHTLNVTVRKDGTDCYREPCIAWTSVRASAGKHRISFVTWQVQAGLHALQRHVERSACPLHNLLPQMDRAMTEALDWLDREDPLRDGDDEYLPFRNGVWAGGLDMLASDPAWGPAFAGDDRQLPVFSVRTFLGEEEMRPMVWLGWSEATGATRGATLPLRTAPSAA